MPYMDGMGKLILWAGINDRGQGYSNDQWQTHFTTISHHPLGIYIFCSSLSTNCRKIMRSSSIMLGSRVGSILKYVCVFDGKLNEITPSQ